MIGENGDVTRTRTRRPAVDAAAAAAVDIARAAAEEVAGPGEVGEHVGVQADDDRVVTHYFRCTALAYRGWRWAVTLARASRQRALTVDEVVLLPGTEALLAPTWVPWSERLRPGDLGVGDLLPTPEDDDRLVPSHAATDDPEVEAVAFELGRGRRRVLSRLGRDEAATRWYDGDGGPRAAIARSAPASCGTCGFYTPLGGALGSLFGACCNEFTPDDGRVVSADHGCGAHSEALVVPGLPVPSSAALIDDEGLELLADLVTPGPGSVDDTAGGEPLGHS